MPTHYAVIDEHGEIVISSKCNPNKAKSEISAEELCHQLKIGYERSKPQAKDWTVKGVTVHE